MYKAHQGSIDHSFENGLEFPWSYSDSPAWYSHFGWINLYSLINKVRMAHKPCLSNGNGNYKKATTNLAQQQHLRFT